MDYYARLTSFQIEGNYQCFQKNFIKQFCIPEINSGQAEIILQLEEDTLQQYICDLFDMKSSEVLEIVVH